MLSRQVKDKKSSVKSYVSSLLGSLASAIQYGTYLLMICWLQPLIANTIAYLVSFTFNYIASTRYTFRVKSTTKRGLGFVFSHVINYVLQSTFLQLFLWLGLSKQLALIPMFAICVPITSYWCAFFYVGSKDKFLDRTGEASERRFFLSRRTFFSLTEHTDLTELFHQRFDPTERLRHTDITERFS